MQKIKISADVKIISTKKNKFNTEFSLFFKKGIIHNISRKNKF